MEKLYLLVPAMNLLFVAGLYFAYINNFYKQGFWLCMSIILLSMLMESVLRKEFERKGIILLKYKKKHFVIYLVSLIFFASLFQIFIPKVFMWYKEYLFLRFLKIHGLEVSVFISFALSYFISYKESIRI